MAIHYIALIYCYCPNPHTHAVSWKFHYDLLGVFLQSVIAMLVDIMCYIISKTTALGNHTYDIIRLVLISLKYLYYYLCNYRNKMYIIIRKSLACACVIICWWLYCIAVSNGWCPHYPLLASTWSFRHMHAYAHWFAQQAFQPQLQQQCPITRLA